jgi:hypothetical protein
MIKNALNIEKMNAFIASSTSRIKSKIWQFTSENIWSWMGHPSVELIDAIKNRIPELSKFIDFDIAKSRIPTHIQVKDEKKFWGDVQFKEFFPELIIVRDKFQEAFVSLPSGIEKTEAWLYPWALEAGANADVEALIYFKSQGESLVSSDEISQIWRQEICIDIERDILLNRNNTSVIKKAKDKKLSLVEITDLFVDSNYFPEFLIVRDEEEEFITPSFFRTVEWLQLKEFDPWIDAYAQEISIKYQDGIDSIYSLYPLLYFCRSDLLLRKASKFGLEAFLYGICVGNIEASKPWKRFWEEPDKTHRKNIIVDYIPTASIIAFAWQRINPLNINKDVLNQALLLIMQTQLNSGGWPLTSKHTNGNILSTCLAMTALGALKPVGYQRYLEKAKKWLLNQQNEVGCWYIQSGPAVMINILCLEAIKLAEGNNHITYKIQEYKSDSSTSSNVVNGPQSDKYIIFCEGNVGGTKNKNFDEKCYTKIFSLEFPNALFCSVGSCNDIGAEEKLLFEVIKKVNPYHNIIKLIDRDDRSEEEIEELKIQGITVLSLRELESYLLEDEIIEKICVVCGKKDKISEVKRIKAEAIKNSIERGNPIDDLKSASGYFFTQTKKTLGLTKCGNVTISFLRDTMAPLITHETNTYLLLRKDIFGF